MKSMCVKFFKDRGIRKIGGRKVELYSFYELCGYIKKFKQGDVIK